MAENKLCGLCTHVKREMNFVEKIFHPIQSELLCQIEKLIGQRVLPQHICTICEEQTQTQPNFATENPNLSEAQALPTEELASNEINLIKEEQESDNEEDNGALPSPLPLSPRDNFNTEDHYDSDNSYTPLAEDQRNGEVRREEPTEADGMKLEEMNEASLPSYSEVNPPKTAECNISNMEEYGQQNPIDSNCELIHTVERPYVCPTCGKGFVTMRSLKIHMLNHNGVRAHRCKTCNKTFKRRQNLLRHYQTKRHKQKEEKLPIDMTN